MSWLWNGARRLKQGRRRAGGTLHASGLIDRDWYLATYPEVARAGRDPAEDYAREGALLGRDPNPLFDTAWYLDRYPDVRAAGANPLLHFIEAGAAEGRDPGPGFDTAYYLESNPEVAAAGVNPLFHFLHQGRAQGRAPRRTEAAILADYDAALARRRRFAAPALDHVHFPLQGPTGTRDPDGRPLPPLGLAQRIGAPTLDEFAWVGHATRQTILRCLPRDFDFTAARVLDFGCGVGRVLRAFSEEARQGEFWGCDIDGPSIRWCVETMAPPFRLFQISETPTIPLESNSFDLVYAISVFAHIHVDWHHWMAEVRRILKPGGHAFISFMAQTPFEEMLRRPYAGIGADFGKYVKNPFSGWDQGGGPMAFHNPDWIKAYWGNLFDIEFIALEGLLEYQSICLMRKPPPGPSVGTEGAVLKYSTAQAFDPDAVGWIHEDHDLAKGFRESYGVEARGAAEVRGWIVFRADRPRDLVVMVDGEDVAAGIELHQGAAYRDWPDTAQTVFVARFDCSALPPGEHRLSVAATSLKGARHVLAIPLVIL